MSNASALGALCYEAETVFGEDSTSFATYRIQTTIPIDASGLEHAKISAEVTGQHRQNGTQWIKTTMGGSFKFRMWWTGHGSTMVGSPSVTARETLDGLVLGTAPALSATASTTLTGGTATVPTTTASGTFTAGSLCRIGTLGDGDGNGQFYKIGTHSALNLTLLGDLDGAPANGAVLYPVVMRFGPEAPTSATVTGTRFLLQTANLMYECHGCYPISRTIGGLSPGEVPFIEYTMGVSWWRYSTATFPSTVATDTFLPAPVAAGSWNFQVVGTTTRNKRTFRNFQLNHTLGVVPLMGPGGVNASQMIVGARRIPDTIEATWTEDADAATTTPVLPVYGTGTSSYHGEYTASPTDGSAVGFACPNMCVTNIAIQKMDGSINRLTITARAYTGATTTSETTLAAIIYGDA